MVDLFYIDTNDWDFCLSSIRIELSQEEENTLPLVPPEQRELFDWDEDVPY
jgi:hypothetical protein